MIKNFFKPVNAKSRNLGNYGDGNIPFVSNSNLNNGVVRYVDADKESEIMEAPCVAVNGFGFATVQMKPFIGAGNGGVHIIALQPIKEMTTIELAWYASQINLQSWRFSYGRRAIQKRLIQLQLKEFNLEDAECREFQEKIENKLHDSLSRLFIK